MGTINYGNQKVTFEYGEAATSENFNKINYKILESGIYDGGIVTKYDDTTIAISPFVCFIADDNNEIAVRVETSTDIHLTVVEATPYIILRMNWADISNNYLDVYAKSYADVQSNDLILSKCIYEGGVLQSEFDTTRRTTTALQTLTDDQDNLKVVPTEPPSDTVIINSGSVLISNTPVNYLGGYSPSISSTTLGRIDYIVLDAVGVIGVIVGTDSGTPVAPDYPDNVIVLAKITRGASKSVIQGHEIEQYIFDRISFHTEELIASSVSIADSGGNYTSTDVEGALAESAQAENISIADSGGNYTSTDVEGALAESAQAENISIADSGSNFNSAENVEDALAELSSSSGGDEIPSGLDTYLSYVRQSYREACVNNWYVKLSATSNNWMSVCWSPELGLFCAVADSGTDNRVMTSPDGVNWTIRTSAANNGWYSVCWSPELGLFCAVAYSGTGNRVMTSPDGINWTTRTSPADNFWLSICWSPELSLFCAVSIDGTGNRVMTSPDGINWTIRSSAADNEWYSVCWSPELSLFCAVSKSGTNDRVMTSPDGITWTSRTPAADYWWRSVCWSPELGLFCAVSATSAGDRVMTSPDGITWTLRTSAADNQWYGVCWSPELGLFCAIANSGTGDRVMTSPDGINWTSRTSAADNSWQSVCWSPELGIFCAVSNAGTGNRVMVNTSIEESI